jgi:uncharacterized membrane protein YuzA (DUF378 family)
MKALHTVAFILLVIGGLNWGLTVFGWGVENFVGQPISNIIYVLVALSAILSIVTHKKDCKCCDSSASTGSAM